jgi:broad specificity phosphatase PhoE
MNLREQHFGIAEGHTYVLTPAPEGADLEAEYYSKKLFPVSLDRKAKFPEGESLEDVAVRVQEAIKEVVVPHLLEGQDGTHIAIVSHGLCIKEILAALNLLDPGHVRNPKELGSFTSGLVNTGWTQVVLTAKACVVTTFMCYRF